MPRAAPSPSRKQRMPVQYGVKKTPERMQIFIDRLAEGDTIGVAADKADIGYTTVYDWKDQDPIFAQLWDRALERGIDKFEQEARRRAFEGNKKPVFNKDGLRVDETLEFSDRLAEFMLKGRRKHVFAERVEQTGAGGGPVQHEIEVTFVRAKDGKRAE